MPNAIGTRFTLTAVDSFFLGNGVECWKIMHVNERQEKYPYVFPKFSLEQRAAEYDLDPTDIPTLLDMVLHEPHVMDPMDYRNFSTDPAAKKGLTIASKRRFAQVAVGSEVPIHLHNAPDRATAWLAHKARLDEVKTRITLKSGKGAGILSKGDTTDPLQQIIDNHGVDPDRVKVRAQYVEAMIASVQGRASSGAPMRVRQPGGLPVAPPVAPTGPYDSSVRRRGLTVALLDT